MRDSPNSPTPIIDPDLPWDMDDPTRAEVRLTNLRDSLEQNNERARAIEVLTQLARARSLQGKLTEADSTLDLAERMLPSVSEIAPRLRVLLERGRLLVLRRTPMEAGSRFWEAWLLAQAWTQTFFAIDAAQMMSVIETPKKQKQWTLRALELAEASKDARTKAWCGHLHLQLGCHYEELLMVPQALESFTAAAACFRDEGTTAVECRARTFMARATRNLGRPSEALEILHQVRVALQNIGVSEGVVFEEIGECLLALQQPEEAAVFFGRAHDLLAADEWLTNNQSARIKRVKKLSETKKTPS